MKIFIILITLAVCSSKINGQTKSFAKDTSIAITVLGNCGQCKQRIEQAVDIKGVKAADWNIDSKILSVTYNPFVISSDKIQQKIIDAGHDTRFKKAKEIVYNSLPACCLYRNPEGGEMMTHHTAHISGDSLKVNLTTFIKGVVMEVDNKGNFKPLSSASVFWLTSKNGVVTDNNGVFNIKKNDHNSRLVISYTGYQSDTVSISDDRELKVILASKGQLKEVPVSSKERSSYISSLGAIRTQIMTEKELFKAACCNLSESFETNPSVDVSYNDAVSGSKQIQLLGLAGVYTQLTVENMPGPRGIATANGLSFIPGTWIESIQLTKGTGSVVNGYESIAGQINIEEKKPEKSEKVYANVYINESGKSDINLNLSKKLNTKWSTALLLHDDFLSNKKMDGNKDGYRDLPSGNLFTVANRWKFENVKGVQTQFGVKFLTDERTGGQVNFNPSTDKFTINGYGIGLNTERYEAFGKLGYA